MFLIEGRGTESLKHPSNFVPDFDPILSLFIPFPVSVSLLYSSPPPGCITEYKVLSNFANFFPLFFQFLSPWESYPTLFTSSLHRVSTLLPILTSPSVNSAQVTPRSSVWIFAFLTIISEKFVFNVSFTWTALWPITNTRNNYLVQSLAAVDVTLFLSSPFPKISIQVS